MNNYKKYTAVAMAAAMAAGLTACGGDSGNAEVTTTTQATVEINTAELSEEDAAKVADVADLLTGELENKTIKWFSFYDPFHASTSGNTKALSLELFEEKYDGNIEYIQTTWANRFNDLSTQIVGGEGVDFIAGGDLDSFPKGVTNGMFQSVDDLIDYDSELWAPQKNINDYFELNGKHYLIATQATTGQVVFYNRQTIEGYGFDDPADLLEAGEWNWDTFKGMLLEFCDADSECYGLDGWFNEQPLMLTAGVPSVELKDGKLVQNFYDANLERSMNFMKSLYDNGLTLDKSLFNWTTHIEFIGEGKELFYIDGLYSIESSPDIWTKTFGEAEDVMFVPLPKDPEADNYYLPAGLEAYMLCKGAQNPEGVIKFMECILAANSDERTLEIAKEKRINDYGWTDDMLEMQQKITEMTAENPVYDIHAGCPTDMYNLIDSGETGIRAAFYGGDWATVRESLSDAVQIYIDEFNAEVEAMSE
ncbi:MAG: extracellular solute-binding protein [Oscillospiraceae bacterium]|nr:extracellular solute-binding protein [Oscillospiraceae bacterium]